MESKGKTDCKKVLITLISVIFMGISLSVLSIIDYGMDSFTYMNVSVSNKLGWTLGNWQMVLNILMFIPVIIWGRKQIGIGTVLNMVLVGYTVDFCMEIWDIVSIEKILNDGAGKIIMMLMALVIFIFSAATYMSANIGTAPFDALPMMFSEKFSNIPFKIIRFVWDLSAVAIGFIFSGKVGIVTILMVLFLGQSVEIVQNKIFKEE